jgi:putative phage-type endonuclease
MHALQAGSKEWHDDRMLGIGGSDCAAALGLSKYKTPFQLYQEKIGEAEPQDETWEMARGKALEPLLRQHYANTTGREVIVPHRAIVSEQYKWMRYNPDGLTEDRLQEFKTAAYGREWGESGTDEIPQEYLLQIQHGLIVTRRDVADCSVSIAGNAPKYFVIEADRELQQMIIEKEHDFWQMVTHRRAPEPTTNEDVAKMYSRVNGASIAADVVVQSYYDGLLNVREKIKYLETKKEEYEVAIKNFMGENETLLHIDGQKPLATWRQQAGARRIDSDLLKKELPEIASKYTKQGEPLRRFLLK